MAELAADECEARLRAAEHGVLATVHPTRGVDAVPVVFVVDGHRVIIPIDTVKAKRSTRLERVANLAVDPRCSVLVEHYESDWSALWWVRAHGNGAVGEPSDAQRDLLASRFDAYRSRQAVVGMICVEVDRLSGWSAS